MFGKVIQGGARALDLFMRRHSLIAQNLAHIETPNYRPQDLDFQGALAAAFKEGGAERAEATDPGHLRVSSPLADGAVVTDTRTAPGRDGNAVDLDRESAKMAQNGLLYDATSRILSHRLALLKHVVTDGGH